MVRLLILAALMAPILGAGLVAAGVPDASAGWAAIRRKLGGNGRDVTYADFGERAVHDAGGHVAKGPDLSELPSGRPSPADPANATTRIPRPPADDFHPDVAGRRATVDPFHGSASPDTHLVAGATVVDGRYRLLVPHGGPPGLQFWQALDTALDRQVALTFVGPDRTIPPGEIDDILQRTLTLGRIDQPGLARVLDVTSTPTGGLVVSEWIRGGSLKEVADTSPSAIGGARAIQSLAAAAEDAHRAGVALSIDHPSRIRVSIDGDVTLAFPATLADASPAGDVRGIGAALYALLVDRWPLRESGIPSGLRPADSDPGGVPVEPRAVNGEIPFQISAAAVRAVQPGGGISSATTLLNLLQQATAAVDRTDLVEPSAPPVPAPPTPRVPVEDPAIVHARRRRNVLIGVAAGGAVLLIALMVLASLLGRIFGDVGGGLKGDQLGLNTTTSAGNTASGAVVKPIGAEVFSPQGGADAPSLAGLAIDGDPSTAWPTDTYTDATPFPGFKNGVGLMLQLPSPTVVGAVTVSVSSTGTQVQIRSSSTASPASLEDTQLLTGPVTVKPGSNTIPVPSAAPTSHLLVWISTLGQTGGKNRTDVSEITVRAAS